MKEGAGLVPLCGLKKFIFNASLCEKESK